MNDAENKTTSRKELGTYFSECVLSAWWRRAQSKRGEKQRRREKLFRNQLGIVCSYQNTLLTQTCHGANICSQLAESVRGMLSVYYTLRHRNTKSWLGTLDINEKSFWKHQWAQREGNLLLWWKNFLFWPTGKLADFLCGKESLPTWETEKKAWFWTSDTYGSVYWSQQGVAYGKPEKLRLINIMA